MEERSIPVVQETANEVSTTGTEKETGPSSEASGKATDMRNELLPYNSSHQFDEWSSAIQTVAYMPPKNVERRPPRSCLPRALIGLAFGASLWLLFQQGLATDLIFLANQTLVF
jgi:hypothetical protein